jgi:cell division protein FtsB
MNAGRQNQRAQRLGVSVLHSKRRHPYGNEIYYIILIFTILLTSAATIWGPGGYLEMKKTRAELETRRARVKALELSNKARLDEIRNLRDDRETLERYARQKGYGKRGEIIQQLPAPSGGSQKPGKN